jgi:hypothetical protein
MMQCKFLLLALMIWFMLYIYTSNHLPCSIEELLYVIQYALLASLKISPVYVIYGGWIMHAWRVYFVRQARWYRGPLQQHWCCGS